MEAVFLLQAGLPTYGCGRGLRSTRTPDFYCVILMLDLPMRPIRAHLFGIWHFSGV
jgi:hypothetical protein